MIKRKEFFDKKEYSEGYSNHRINPLLAKCFRCLYEWIPKSEEIKTCANKKCRTPYWDKARNKLNFYFMRGWAANVVRNAKMRGYVGQPSFQKCVDCGKKSDHWEHRNYARPLIVVPVCRSCNKKRGSSNNLPRKKK